MHRLSIVTPISCLSLVLAFAALPVQRASAQDESVGYHDRWLKPFFEQQPWDEGRWEAEKINWNVKGVEPENVTDVEESTMWHDRWWRPFSEQWAWDEGRWERHRLGWHNKITIEPEDVSDATRSVAYHDRWAKPFFEQPAWDEQQWEDHCIGIHTRSKSGYKHSEDNEMDYRSE